MIKRDFRKQVKATGSGQYPFTTVLSCMDSRAVKEIRDRSPVLREMADKGEIAIVGAMLDVKTGKVTFYDKI